MPVIHSEEVETMSPLPGFEAKRMISQANGSHATTLITEILHPGAKIPVHRHNVEGAIYVFAGTGYLTIEGEGKYKIESGTGILVPANTWYSFGNNSTEDLKLVTFHPSIEITKEEQ